MKLDRTLLDKGRAPTVEEMKDYFKKNDYTTAPPTFDTSRAKYVKTLSSTIGHISAETTLNTYSHVTDRMRIQASVKIDRKIGGTDAEVPEAPDEPKETQTSEVEENFEPYEPKIRKSGTGCVYQVNDTLWEGSFYPRLPNGKRKKFNVYAKTRKECEKKLAKMITEKKKEIAKQKEAMKKLEG